MRRLSVILGLVLSVLFVFGSVGVAHASQAPVPGEYYGAGYWKTHSEYWPEEPISVGWTSMTKAELTELFSTPPKGDMSYVAAQQMAAATLNRQNGGEPIFLSVHQNLYAVMWFVSNPPGSGLRDTDPAWVSATSGPWSGASLTSLLEYYNTYGPPPLP